ncbi:MAG: tyrosine-type recombinase/integrase [Bacteroidetes bacterium]|nr:tyrosine-type recombinase/integrase [Bacteroidota bacterium]
MRIKVFLYSKRKYDYYHTCFILRAAEKQFRLRIVPANRLNKKEFKKELKYWKKFYKSFTDYLYDDLGHYDNYVGRTAKLIRAFFKYLSDEQGINVSCFNKNFYAYNEDIQIVVLSAERLNFLIYSKEFDQALNPMLRKVKDIFVFACTVALRHSDLALLRRTNLETINDRVYLSTLSKKTQTFSRVKLPDYALQIIERYKKYRTLLPPIHLATLDKQIKNVMEQAGWTEPFVRTGTKRGIPLVIHKNPETKAHYRFCDMISMHTARRTAITTMLSLGMDEQLVRKVSGHTAGSKEFYKYVSYAQTYMDNAIDLMHQKLEEKQLEIA